MKKTKSLIILIVVSLIPLLFTTTIPYSSPVQSSLNTPKSSEHIWDWEVKIYSITLTEGSEYTITVDVGSFWSLDVSIRIATNPYMIMGFSVDSNSYTGEIMHFTAPKSETYYIQIKVQSGSGFYDILIEPGTVGTATASTIEFFDVSYLLVLLLPSLFIFTIGLIILMRLRKRPQTKRKRKFVNVYRKVEQSDDTIKEDNTMICPYCGREIEKNLQRCPECNSSLK